MATSLPTKYTILSTAQFNKDVRSLDPQVQVRLVKKLKTFEQHPDPLSLAEPLINSERGQYRWRMGTYRITFDQDGNKIYLLNVRHRRDVYR